MGVLSKSSTRHRFDIALSNDGGMGMRTMRERAELLGGQLSVIVTGHGTSVLLRAEIKDIMIK
jgi:signal transduction histidine kinase